MFSFYLQVSPEDQFAALAASFDVLAASFDVLAASQVRVILENLQNIKSEQRNRTIPHGTITHLLLDCLHQLDLFYGMRRCKMGMN